MNGKEIEGREIAVKVAIDSPGKEDDHVDSGDAEAPLSESKVTSETADKPADTPAATPAA